MGQFFIKYNDSKKKEIESVIKEILEINDSHDVNLLEEGLILMYEIHEGQLRLNKKQPYTDHTTAVGKYLAAEFPTKDVVAGFLHDLEKTDKTINNIRLKFSNEGFGEEGNYIANIVDYMIPKTGESNIQHNQRIIEGIVAIPVRAGDISDNIETDDVFEEDKKIRRYEEAQYSFVEPLETTPFAETNLYKNLKKELDDRLGEVSGTEQLSVKGDRRIFIRTAATTIASIILTKKK